MIEPLLQAERLLLHGMLDQAEALYRRTLDGDPLNAIAAVGLAKVALERDDFRLAYEHACLALEIDPRNPSALRLEARVSEVLAARGEPVERPSWLATDEPLARPQPRSEPRSEPGPDAPAQPTREQPAAPSERAVFAKNRSMADHRQMENTRHGPPAGGPADAQPDQPASPESTGLDARPQAGGRGLLRRLIGR